VSSYHIYLNLLVLSIHLHFLLQNHHQSLARITDLESLVEQLQEQLRQQLTELQAGQKVSDDQCQEDISVSKLKNLEAVVETAVKKASEAEKRATDAEAELQAFGQKLRQAEERLTKSEEEASVKLREAETRARETEAKLQVSCSTCMNVLSDTTLSVSRHTFLTCYSSLSGGFRTFRAEKS
jgi:hypothetical protein